jgi:isochorismate synthase
VDHAGFVLSGAHRTLSTKGLRRAFNHVADAQSALRESAARLVAGAIPFDVGHPCALAEPEEFVFADGPWQPRRAPALPHARIIGEVPSHAEHVGRVRALIDLVERTELEKVVAARSVLLQAERPIAPMDLLSQLVAQDHVGNGFCVDLTPAGGDYEGRRLIGASPEILVRRHGRTVTCRPLAGSAPRCSDPAEDEASAQALLDSQKNQHEHSFVVQWIRERLAPFCASLDVPAAPSLSGTPDVWHLGTAITGILADPDTSALDLALAVHPTPAVCGTPTLLAMRMIKELEEDRGFYAGTVGWCDDAGDGEWMVAIRCAELSDDGYTARAFAGGGIVAGSDPESELAETTMKLRTVLGAFGIDPHLQAGARRHDLGGFA